MRGAMPGTVFVRLWLKTNLLFEVTFRILSPKAKLLSAALHEQSADNSLGCWTRIHQPLQTGRSIDLELPAGHQSPFFANLEEVNAIEQVLAIDPALLAGKIPGLYRPAIQIIQGQQSLPEHVSLHR